MLKVTSRKEVPNTTPLDPHLTDPYILECSSSDSIFASWVIPRKKSQLVRICHCLSPSPSRNSFAYTQISEIFIVNFDTSNMSIIAPGIYKIKNKSTSNYIAAHSGDQPYSIIRTADPNGHGTFPVFTFKIEPYQIGGASIASTFTNLYVGIAQPADGTPLEWAPSHEPQPVGFVPVNDGSYLIRLPPAGNLPVERYAYEKGKTQEVAVIRNLDEPGLHWILEKA
ncbi:hypothetical protein D9757_004955 [Collybiopsis confluens]|uniref:Uncharacterized protein n=1 Tax=Collybiopsis confluens TaxID=2823264 RepID=A0A8H5HT42_9AGAR|nr:hypothetical protein D9757_004955 [Collybiopsis confluens]